MKRYLPLKRGLDVVFSAVGLVVASPVMALCAIAVKTGTPGPAIFRQTRLGLYGEPFTIYKFRSMTVGSEAAGVYETVGDSRVTKVGHVLRHTSLDEVPQLINILRGEMSFIGPRPTLTYHPWPYEQYSAAQKRRFDVRPGVTGLSQVSGRKQVPWDERLKLDTYYADNVSLRLDASVLIRTLKTVLTANGNVNVGRTTPDRGLQNNVA